MCEAVDELQRRWINGVVTFGLVALAAGLTAIFLWVARQKDLEARMPEFIGLLLVAGILYVIAVFCVERFRLGTVALVIILASSVLFRIVLLISPVALSDDVYRYQWDGRAQRAGLNPYTVFPSAPGLAWLRSPEKPEPPGPDTPTIYPPLSELAYKHIATVRGYKRASAAFDLASTGVLLLLLGARKQPLPRAMGVRGHFLRCGVRVLHSVPRRRAASVGWREKLRAGLGEQREPLPSAGFCRGIAS